MTTFFLSEVHAQLPFAFWRPVCELNAGWTPQWPSVIGYWPLNGTVGASIANNDSIPAAVGPVGTAKNTGASYVAGKVGAGAPSAVTFTTNSYITMGTAAALNGTGMSQGSLLVWLKPNPSANNAQTIIGKELSYKLQLEDKTGDGDYPSGGSSVTLYISTNGTSWRCEVQTKGAIASNTWVHIAATWDQTNPLKIYFNGVSQLIWTPCNLSSGGVPANTAYPFQLGGWDGTNELYRNGTMDEAAVFNTALTAAEITKIYERQSACHY